MAQKDKFPGRVARELSQPQGEVSLRLFAERWELITSRQSKHCHCRPPEVRGRGVARVNLFHT